MLRTTLISFLAAVAALAANPTAEIRALQQQHKNEIKALKTAHKTARKEWEQKEKEARHKYFAEHKHGPERRAYIQDFIARREVFKKAQDEELATLQSQHKAKLEAVQNDLRNQQLGAQPFH